MNTLEIRSLNPEITNERISMPYPHIKVLEPSDAIALVLPSLDKGDLPVLCEYNGTCRQIGSIRKSALVIEQLHRISKLMYCSAENKNMSIETKLDILEVLA